MATNLKGPGIYLAQFAGDTAPFGSWDEITRWAGQLGFKGVQIPSWDGRLFDLQRAAESRTYCDEIKGIARANGVEVTELGEAVRHGQHGEVVRLAGIYFVPLDRC